MSEERRIEAGRHHVSKSYIPITIIRSFWIVIAIVIAGFLNLLDEAENIFEYAGTVRMLPIFAVIAFVGIMGIIGLISAIGYHRLTWEITDEELHIYKGIIIRKKSHIPFRRIHSVDINAKILDRIFGVVTVKLDTAAGSGSSEDAKIPTLQLSTAEILRSEIFHRKNIAENASDQEVKTGGGNILKDFSMENDSLRGIYAGSSHEMTPESEYRLTNKELILFCLANGKTFAVIFAILFFVYEAVDVLNRISHEIGEEVDKFVNSIFSGGVFLVAGIILAALLLGLVFSFITRALTYGNFVVRRYGGRIEVSTGLIQKKSTGVAVERIQTLKIKQGLFQRILGYAEISIETATGISPSGGNDQNVNLGVILHPFVKTKNVDDFMDKMLNEFKDRPERIEGLTGLAMRRSIFRYGMWTALFVILPINLCWYFIRPEIIGTPGIIDSYVSMEVIELINNALIWSSVSLFVIMLILGWAVWKGRAYGRNDHYIAMRKGVLGRTRIFIPKKKIQYAQVSQNPFQKRVNLATVKANTAVLNSTNQSVKDVGISKCSDYLEWMILKK